MRTHLWRILALLLVLALVAAACSDSDDDSSTDTTAAAADTTAASETTAAAETTEADPAETTAAEIAEGDGSAERGDDWPTEITFAAAPSEQDTSLQDSYAITLEIMQDELGLDSIELFQAADYAGVIEARTPATSTSPSSARSATSSPRPTEPTSHPPA